MSESSPSQPSPVSVSTSGLTNAEIDLSCQIPLLILFGAAAFWLVLSSFLALIASMTFHKPDLFADTAWLTYGRIRPAANDCFLYGFAIPGGVGVALWLFARLGRALLAQPLFVSVGVLLWNFGVLLGITGILIGDGTGYELFDMPRYAALFLFIGYVTVAIFGLITFHTRAQRTLHISQWFLIAAILWFPWIFTTANMLLLVYPVRGVMQAVIAWWYAGNLLWLWFSLIGLGILFYLVPRFTRREIANYYLAAVTFWILLLAASWIGVPNSAPVPAALPSVGTVGAVFTGFAVLTFILNLNQTLDGRWSILKENVVLRFAGLALLSFIFALVLNIIGSISQVAEFTDLTWYPAGVRFLQSYGFLTLLLFGLIYHIVPQLLGIEIVDGVIASSVARLARINLLVAVLGLLFTVVPFIIGGIVQGIQLNNANIAFTAIISTSKMVMRVATIGDLLVLIANAVFMISLGRLVIQFYKARAAAAYAEATAIIPTAGVKI